MKHFIVGPVVRVLFRPWVKGLDNIPDSGPAVLVSNHLSFSDSIFLPLNVPRRVVFLAKSEYFNGRGLKGRLTAAFFRLTNQLPMDRSGGAASASSLSAGVDVLKAGGLLGIYPEGTRSPDGRLYRGKTGVAKLVLATGVPVIPVAMVGTDKVQPIGRKIPNIRRVGIIFGKPLDFTRYHGLENDRFVQRSVTDEIMYELMHLSGQEYVDAYASTVKDQLAAARKAHRAPEAGRREPGVRLPGTVTVIGGTSGPPPVQDSGPPPVQDSAVPEDGAGTTGTHGAGNAGTDGAGQQRTGADDPGSPSPAAGPTFSPAAGPTISPTADDIGVRAQRDRALPGDAPVPGRTAAKKDTQAGNGPLERGPGSPIRPAR